MNANRAKMTELLLANAGAALVSLCQNCQTQLWHTEAAASAIMPYPYRIWHGGTAAWILTDGKRRSGNSNAGRIGR